MTTMTTSDITAFVESQAQRIRELEARVAELETEVEKEPVYCEYNGLEFWLTELFAGYGVEGVNYGYTLRDRNAGWVSGGGAYETRHDATKAAFTRIETLTFNR